MRANPANELGDAITTSESKSRLLVIPKKRRVQMVQRNKQQVSSEQQKRGRFKRLGNSTGDTHDLEVNEPTEPIDVAV